MKFEVLCPDCCGRGYFTIIEGDQFKGYSECWRCGGNQMTEIEIPEDEVYDIIYKLIETQHELISKHL